MEGRIMSEENTEGPWVISQKEYELFQKLKKIWIHSSPEKSGAYFICGEAGEKDKLGLPDGILVCPTYGLDGFAYYKKAKDYTSPGW
jgi:hypothetical protein